MTLPKGLVTISVLEETQGACGTGVVSWRGERRSPRVALSVLERECDCAPKGAEFEYRRAVRALCEYSNRYPRIERFGVNIEGVRESPRAADLSVRPPCPSPRLSGTATTVAAALAVPGRVPEHGSAAVVVVLGRLPQSRIGAAGGSGPSDPLERRP